MEKALADYREELGRPFEHEARLRELLLQQSINKQLDLDKGEVLAVANDNVPQEEETPDSFVPPLPASGQKSGWPSQRRREN